MTPGRDRLVSGGEGAEILGISEPSFWRLVHRGLIPVVDLSGTGHRGRGRKLWRFRESDIWEYVTQNTRIETRANRAPRPKRHASFDAALIAAGWDGDLHPTSKKLTPEQSPNRRGPV
jgi:predicted DNA-binding transcriptional regulator AlpA